MNNNKLFRIAGWCAMAGAICIPLAMVSFILSGTAPVAGMIGMIFEILGLLLLFFIFYALSVAHRSESKWLGFAGMILLVIAIAVDVVSQQLNSTFLYGLWYFLYSLPFLIFGYLGLRSARLPHLLAVLVLLTGVINFIAGVVGLLGNPTLADNIQQFSIPLYLAWEVWLWRVLVSQKYIIASPEPVTD